MNANDEGGIIMGNWGRDFSDGVEPWSWTGSTEILQQYMRTKKSVQYGQCWVFCGVATTSENSFYSYVLTIGVNNPQPQGQSDPSYQGRC